VTASNAGGSGQASSAAVVPVATAQAPVNQTRPVITGTPTVGQTLSCSQGTWSNNPTGYAYVWIRNGGPGVGSGSTYTIQAADAGQVLTCMVTASNSAGSTSATSDPVTVTSGGLCNAPAGVSIRSGTAFTNTQVVPLSINPPAGADSVIVSNDGGFANPSIFVAVCGHPITWTLATAGYDKITKIVYVRFSGPGVDSDKVYTDDIVYDSTPPVVSSATLRQSTTGSGYVLRLAATDRVSGVSRIQVASSRNVRRFNTRAYKSKISVRYKATARYVRAIDRAGNVGKWRAVRTTKR
jgi:hypothetical protein